MRLYLPTCTAAELAQVFGPVEGALFLLEGHEPERILEFRRVGGALAASEVRIEKRLAWLGDYLRKTRSPRRLTSGLFMKCYQGFGGRRCRHATRF